MEDSLGELLVESSGVLIATGEACELLADTLGELLAESGGVPKASCVLGRGSNGCGKASAFRPPLAGQALEKLIWHLPKADANSPPRVSLGGVPNASCVLPFPAVGAEAFVGNGILEAAAPVVAGTLEAAAPVVKDSLEAAAPAVVAKS